ncbi:hypothetical protein [Desulfosporosinus sp.]|uniref:hypothetical protein n=1 Tax=Desulfosporosinus sp. TaxID=157907 RepID=UPI00262F50FC|nr:hypothetical protein [Desulfosporosinus sp.]
MFLICTLLCLQRAIFCTASDYYCVDGGFVAGKGGNGSVGAGGPGGPGGPGKVMILW